MRSSGFKVGLPGGSGVDLVITFDDGEQNVYQHAFPLLKKYSMKAVIFLIVDYIGRLNSWDLTLGKELCHLGWNEIHEMHEYGMEFGSHGMSHSNLTKVDNDVLNHELQKSKQIIEGELGLCRCISYPFNRANQRVVDLALSAGYKYGFGGDGSSLMLIKKEAIYITDTKINFRIKLNERSPFYAYERMKQKIINMFTLVTMLYHPVQHYKGDHHE
ncbi:hypothetical protein A2Y85_05865 [candidate division WOR-3 bacterium RBG_13_43_14]|uniref:NodB homology domain-containing protein n=1 Tax=candidate division WOR-3 bacterium RBG_13_43_14 TaxID=1802590 RepID=A0A1F4U968_UNCW3|nr:MAG: hypothetical protein A2Y85_05865 [candidate division WOR-3 bacterium RBG_13_43_14]